MTRISDKFPTYQDFWNEYRTAFLEFHKDLVMRAVAAYILHTLYYYWKDSRYEPFENVFYGKFFSKATQDAINYTRSQGIYENVFKVIKLNDKKLFESGSKTEHSKVNERIKQGPKITEQTNIPYSVGNNMISNNFGRAQLMKTKTHQKENTKEITKGRRVQVEEGVVEYKPTYDETTTWGDRSWLGKLLSALQYIKFDFDPKSYQFLFISLFGASGYFITSPSGRKKWISTTLEEEEEDEQQLPQLKKKKTDDSSEITWEEWKGICAKQSPVIIPTQDNFYLEQITRYRKRKEKERAPIGSLTALGIEKKKELSDGLIKAWEKPLNVPVLTKFEEVMKEVVGYEEFKDKMRIYIVNLTKDILMGKKTDQTIYILLGPPGIGKSYIAEKLAEAMDRHLIDISLGGRKDTAILEGVSASTKDAFSGRICKEISESKDRGAIILLDEFEKVGEGGLEDMIGNVWDTKKNKDWFDQFLGYRVDLSNCILLGTANYADQVKDFVLNRAELVNIELTTYQQRVDYTLKELSRKLQSDADTAHYAQQITSDFAKYIITEEWGYRQLNANIENIYKTVRAYADPAINKPITDLKNWTNLEQTNNRWTFTYQQRQKITLVRVRTENKQKQSVLSPELNLNWPLHDGFTKPKVVITK